MDMEKSREWTLKTISKSSLTLQVVEEPWICDNSIQCDDGADETECDEEYVRKKIFTIKDKHRCNSVYLNFTRSDGSTGRFYPERGIR